MLHALWRERVGAAVAAGAAVAEAETESAAYARARFCDFAFPLGVPRMCMPRSFNCARVTLRSWRAPRMCL